MSLASYHCSTPRYIFIILLYFIDLQYRTTYYGTTSTDMLRDVKKYEIALQLRQTGISIRTIAKTLKISTSTASIWCRNIKLSDDQLEQLRKKSQNTLLLQALAQKKHLDKVKRHESIIAQSLLELGNVTKRERFIAGIALYWAEGFKSLSEGRIGFCNSDPKMIKFMLYWFIETFNLQNEDFILRAEFNIAHIEREREIQKYWSNITGIPLKQFNKSFYHKAKQLRDYSKRGIYYGVLRIRVRKSSDFLVKLRGLISGLS